MKMNPRAARLFVVGIWVFATLTAEAGPPPARGSYHVIDLGRLGGFRSEARAINARGDIAGGSASDAGYQAARWLRDGTNYVIAALGSGDAYGIADDATVAGLSSVTGGGTLWPPAGPPIHLDADRRFSAMSADGVPVGWMTLSVTNPAPPYNSKLVKHAARFMNGRATDLALDPLWDCVANGVDATGQIVVGSMGAATNAFVSPQATHAWLFPGRDLHSLANLANSVALAVNSSTQVVGYANNVSTGQFNQPMLWSGGTKMRLLRVPAGDPNGAAFGINDRGQAVGALTYAGAVLWVNLGQPDETNVVLNSLPPAGHGWNLQAAYAINNLGEIVGYGRNPEGYTDAFVLVPTNIVHRTLAGTAVVFGHEQAPQTTNWLKTTNWLEAARVTLWQTGPDGRWFTHTAVSAQDQDGGFRFTVREPIEARFAIQVTLADQGEWVKVCFQPFDSSQPAWVQTPAFTAPSDARADLEMHINEARSVGISKNEATYYFNGQRFNPGGVFNPPAGLPDGDSNVSGGLFAHLGVIYRNVRLAERFARDELQLQVSPARVLAYCTNATSWGVRSGESTLFINEGDTPYNYSFVETNGVRRLQGGNRPTNREFHEYGHHIMWTTPLRTALPGFTGDDGTGYTNYNHGGLTNSNSADSWAEGFAAFIGTAIAQRMLDAPERGRAGFYLVGNHWNDLKRVYSLDNPVSPGRQLVSSSPAEWGKEDLVVASLLWDFHGGRTPPHPPLAEYVQRITGFDISYTYLTNLARLYEILRGYGASQPAKLSAQYVEARFVLGGFYDDWTFNGNRPTDGNGLFDTNEVVGVTSWNTNFLHRPNWTLPLSSHVHLNAFNDSGQPLSDVRAEMRTITPPPWDGGEVTNVVFLSGSGPWEFPVFPPPPPATVVLRLFCGGLRASAELGMDAEWFLMRQTEARPDELLLEHDFMLGRPRLRALLQPDGTIEVSWPADTDRVTLEYASALPAAVWLPVLQPQVVAGENRVVTLASTPDARFLRLRAE